jgi:hypothetical protein
MLNCRRLELGQHICYRFSLAYSDIETMPEKLDVLIDFRSKDEALLKTTVAQECINIPMIGVGEKYRKTKIPSEGDLLDFYVEIVEIHRKGFQQLKDIIITHPKVGFGCYFGKDRSGIAAYLISVLFGKKWEKIIKDYELSTQELTRNIELFEAHWCRKGVSKEDYLKRLHCTGDTLLKLDQYIKRKFGSVEGYLFT